MNRTGRVVAASLLACVAAAWPALAEEGTVTPVAPAEVVAPVVEAAPVVAAPPPPVEPAPAPVPPPLTGPERVTVTNDPDGARLRVEGRPFMVFGMNWDSVPIGENYAYSLWTKPDDFIERTLHREMSLLRGMGVNAIRQYVGIPARWITWIRDHYGIYTVLNHPMARYGMTIDGTWVSPVDYSQPGVRAAVKKEVAELVAQYRDTRGLLFWLLGNENNYGLAWVNAAIANLPKGDQDKARATSLYTLFGEVIRETKAADARHPVAIANGDLQYIDLIAEHCQGLDLMGANVYRGRSSRDLFDVVKQKLGVPFVYTEFGADAYDAKNGREDGVTQAGYLRDQWREIYEQSAGKGGAGNAVGGLVFQWSDGWWKHLQESNLDVHDANASWANNAYPEDLVEGGDNMNEEWWGIVAKGPSGPDGLYDLSPRAAYYLLRDGWMLDPFAADTTPDRIRAHWNALKPEDFSAAPNAHEALRRLDLADRVRISDLVFEQQNFITGGRNLIDPARNLRRFDHLETAYLTVEVSPTPEARGSVTLNVLGNVPQNPIDEIFFENRGLPRTFVDAAGLPVTVRDTERLKLYQATFDWKTAWFDLTGFYRSGHYHWGYEGDFFAIFPEANYQRSVDLFNADAPAGFIVTGRKELSGLTVAFGPELYWGANPSLIAKYSKRLGVVDATLVHQEDIAQRASAGTSSAIPMPQTRKTALALAYSDGPLKLEWGAISAGWDRMDRPYADARPTTGASYTDSGYTVLDDVIRPIDTLGTKLKATWTGGGANFYVQGGYRGLVADSFTDQTITFTGFRLKESGQGNHWHAIAGGAFNFGPLQVAPNFVAQKPLVGPLPPLGDLFDAATGRYYAGLRPRSLLNDPFWVRSNREMYAGELLVTWDPTPGTWFWQWNNPQREDAPFAASLDLIYRHYTTAQDAAIGVLASGVFFTFPGSAPAQDLWELWARFVVNTGSARVVGAAWAGTGQANGDSPRLVTRGGVEARIDSGSFTTQLFAKVFDWGPYDYHRDFNLTFPLQLAADVAWTLGTPEWFFPNQTKVGLAGKYRISDVNSPRVVGFGVDPLATGDEWEVRSYVRISL